MEGVQSSLQSRKQASSPDSIDGSSSTTSSISGAVPTTTTTTTDNNRLQNRTPSPSKLRQISSSPTTSTTPVPLQSNRSASRNSFAVPPPPSFSPPVTSSSASSTSTDALTPNRVTSSAQTAAYLPVVPASVLMVSGSNAPDGIPAHIVKFIAARQSNAESPAAQTARRASWYTSPAPTTTTTANTTTPSPLHSTTSSSLPTSSNSSSSSSSSTSSTSTAPTPSMASISNPTTSKSTQPVAPVVNSSSAYSDAPTAPSSHSMHSASPSPSLSAGSTVASSASSTASTSCSSGVTAESSPAPQFCWPTFSKLDPSMLPHSNSATASGWSPLSSPMPMSSSLNPAPLYLFPPLSPVIHASYSTPISSPRLPSAQSAKRSVDCATPIPDAATAGLASSSPIIFDGQVFSSANFPSNISNTGSSHPALPPLPPSSPYQGGWNCFPLSPLLISNTNANNLFLPLPESVSQGYGSTSTMDGLTPTNKHSSNANNTNNPNTSFNFNKDRFFGPYRNGAQSTVPSSGDSGPSSSSLPPLPCDDPTVFIGLPRSVFNAGQQAQYFSAPNSVSFVSPNMKSGRSSVSTANTPVAHANNAADGSVTETSHSSPGGWMFGRRVSVSDRSSPRSQMHPSSPMSTLSPASPSAALQQFSVMTSSPQLPSLYSSFPPSPLSKLPAQAQNPTFYHTNAVSGPLPFAAGVGALGPSGSRPSFESSSSNSFFSNSSDSTKEEQTASTPPVMSQTPAQSVAFYNSQTVADASRYRSGSNSSSGKRKAVPKASTPVAKSSKSSPPKKRKSKSSSESYENNYKSEIECGVVIRAGNGNREHRVSSMHLEFFGKPIKVYTATKDPARRVLIKASDLSSHLHCTNNMLAMYLSRRKKERNSGIFQATGINFKNESRKDLKQGGYFVSLEACEAFRQYKEKKTGGR